MGWRLIFLRWEQSNGSGRLDEFISLIDLSADSLIAWQKGDASTKIPLYVFIVARLK
jgi:hypothetical protein